MKSGTPLFRFPFVIIRRERYQELIVAEERNKELDFELRASEESCSYYERLYNLSLKRNCELSKELKSINLTRNAKGQFERREKI